MCWIKMEWEDVVLDDEAGSIVNFCLQIINMSLAINMQPLEISGYSRTTMCLDDPEENGFQLLIKLI